MLYCVLCLNVLQYVTRFCISRGNYTFIIKETNINGKR